MPAVAGIASSRGGASRRRKRAASSPGGGRRRPAGAPGGREGARARGPRQRSYRAGRFRQSRSGRRRRPAGVAAPDQPGGLGLAFGGEKTHGRERLEGGRGADAGVTAQVPDDEPRLQRLRGGGGGGGGGPLLPPPPPAP